MLDDFLRKSIQDYFDYVHPLFPITDPESVDARFNQKEHLYDKPFASLMLSIAALPLVLPNREAGSEGESTISSTRPLVCIIPPSWD